ncbi:MAG: hypothetical protein HYT12_02415 [Candidatus Liptonbacteria bacterium]|nr:hypothetical protein [Candidatus Liptonbacteria bacterium]
MPTGYTADLNDGKQVTFSEFAMKCARAFGALIEMRDDSLDAPIPDEFRPSNYHLDAIETAKKRLAEVEKWSNARAEREAKKAFDDEVRSSKKYGEKNEKTGRAYIAMLKQAGKWVPPTKDHEGLKSFMIDQLAESVEFDCLHTPTMPQRLSGKQYRTQLVKNARRDIAYHTKEHNAEVRRARERSEWVRELRHSLNGAK